MNCWVAWIFKHLFIIHIFIQHLTPLWAGASRFWCPWFPVVSTKSCWPDYKQDHIVAASLGLDLQSGSYFIAVGNPHKLCICAIAKPSVSQGHEMKTCMDGCVGKLFHNYPGCNLVIKSAKIKINCRSILTVEQIIASFQQTVKGCCSELLCLECMHANKFRMN